MVGAVAERPDENTTTSISIAELSSVRHVIVGPAGEVDVLLSDSTDALTLCLAGARALTAPVAVSFLVEADPRARRTIPALERAADLLFRPRHRIHRSRERLLQRDALIALDAACAGASLRGTASLIYGVEFVGRVWPGEGEWLKSRMRRARSNGEMLRDGGYRKFLQ